MFADDVEAADRMEDGEGVEGAIGSSAATKSLCSNCAVTTSHLSITSKGIQSQPVTSVSAPKLHFLQKSILGEQF